LQASAGDDVGGASVLCHVQRILIAHIDDRGANLDAPGPGTDSRQQREGRAELAGEVMYAEKSPVRAEFLGSDGELDRLQQGVGSTIASATGATETNGQMTGSQSFSWGRRHGDASVLAAANLRICVESGCVREVLL
jgi:hypothetical protein